MKKILCHDWGLNPGRPRDRRTLYHVAIKADLYHKAVQEYHIPIPGVTLMYNCACCLGPTFKQVLSGPRLCIPDEKKKKKKKNA